MAQGVKALVFLTNNLSVVGSIRSYDTGILTSHSTCAVHNLTCAATAIVRGLLVRSFHVRPVRIISQSPNRIFFVCHMYEVRMDFIVLRHFSKSWLQGNAIRRMSMLYPPPAISVDSRLSSISSYTLVRSISSTTYSHFNDASVRSQARPSASCSNAQSLATASELDSRTLRSCLRARSIVGRFRLLCSRRCIRDNSVCTSRCSY